MYKNHIFEEKIINSIREIKPPFIATNESLNDTRIYISSFSFDLFWLLDRVRYFSLVGTEVNRFFFVGTFETNKIAAGTPNKTLCDANNLTPCKTHRMPVKIAIHYTLPWSTESDKEKCTQSLNWRSGWRRRRQCLPASPKLPIINASTCNIISVNIYSFWSY